MGVDAYMGFRLARIVTNDELREWAYQLSHIMGPNHFMIDRNSDRHALSKSHKDGFCETTVSVNIWGRLYDFAYERGDWKVYYFIYLWIKQNVPEATIYYYGDSSSEELELDDTRAATLLHHYLDTGNEPYQRGFQDPDPDLPTPYCDLCKKVMSRFGWGGGGIHGSWQCLGCHYRMETKNGGVTYEEVKDDSMG